MTPANPAVGNWRNNGPEMLEGTGAMKTELWVQAVSERWERVPASPMVSKYLDPHARPQAT
jgi:hypothetical protein